MNLIEVTGLLVLCFILDAVETNFISHYWRRKKSIRSYVHWLHKEREIWYSSISWVSPWLNEKALLDEAVKLNTPFVNWNANTESNCYSRQVFLIVMFNMGVAVQQKILAFFLFQIKCDLCIEKYLRRNFCPCHVLTNIFRANAFFLRTTTEAEMENEINLNNTYHSFMSNFNSSLAACRAVCRYHRTKYSDFSQTFRTLQGVIIESSIQQTEHVMTYYFEMTRKWLLCQEGRYCCT